MDMSINWTVIKTWFALWGLGVGGSAELLALPPAACPLRRSRRKQKKQNGATLKA